MKDSSYRIGVIGLGYVGLPLAVEFAKYYPVVGFDINNGRVAELRGGNDSTLEVSSELLGQVSKTAAGGDDKGLYCSSVIEDIRSCNVYIVTVPTPVDKHNHP